MILIYLILLFGSRMIIFKWFSQLESTSIVINKLTRKYENLIDKKVYALIKRISSKTGKAHIDIGKWEQKNYKTFNIINQEMANGLYGEPNQIFTDALKKFRERNALMDVYTLRY